MNKFTRLVKNRIEVKLMNENQYNKLAEDLKPKVSYFKNAVLAFLFGGCIGLFGQILVRIYMNVLHLTEKEAGTPMIVTMILIACVLTGLGIFDKIAKYAGAGTFVPITGFANALTSAALESKSEGIVLGVASNMFKLGGAVITFGVVAAYVMGVIRYVFFG